MSGACSGYAWCVSTSGVCSAVQKLEAPDATATNHFGISVSVDGTTLAVGRSDTTSGGSVQFVERQADGNWLLDAKVTAGTYAVAGSGFGSAVSLSGNRLVVGAYVENTSTGAAYLFERPAPGGTWTQVPLRWAGPSTGGEFGWSVAQSGDRVIVGAMGDSSAVFDAGAAYVFERNQDGTWPATGTRLVAPDATTYASFGEGVAMSGDRVIVGGGGNPHGAYVFLRQSAGVWTLEQKLLPSDGALTDAFGASVAIEGDRALVGAYSSSSVYVFERQASGTWLQTAKLVIPAPFANTSNQLGRTVSLSGDLALSGSWLEDRVLSGVTYTQAGAAFLFQHQADGSWSSGIDVKSNDADMADFRDFGGVVSISGNFAAIAADGDYRTAQPRIRTGAAYVVDVRSLLP
jgi:hypothetical protein